jgi:hypothetical protein
MVNLCCCCRQHDGKGCVRIGQLGQGCTASPAQWALALSTETASHASRIFKRLSKCALNTTGTGSLGNSASLPDSSIL